MLSQARALAPHEQGAALSLWQEVFETPPGYFERYYGADPNYVPGDTLGIWDGDALVSAVHVCRRPVTWEGGILFCGGIANVATREPYRRQGLSRQLLSLLIVKMEREGFAYSLLGTGTPTHYSALGWQPTERPQTCVSLSLSELPAPSALSWQEAEGTEPYQNGYALAPRTLQFLRPLGYFENWVGWDWRRQQALITRRAEGDYLALENAVGPEALNVVEWRAGNEAAELALLQAAAAKAREMGSSALWLDTNPQFLSDDALRTVGEIDRHVESGGMIRNIALAPEVYAGVAQAYRSGQAAWWAGDGF